LKYDSTGDLLWAQQYNGPSNSWDFVRSLVVDSDGSVYVTGGSSGYNGGWGLNITTLKYDADGTLIWERRFDRAPDWFADDASAVVLDDDGNVIVVGRSETESRVEYPYVYYYNDFIILKYASNGDLIWSEQYDGPAGGDDQASDVRVDIAGNIYVAGWSEGIGTMYDFAVLKYDPTGNLLWAKRHNGASNLDDFATEIQISSVGTVCVTGFSEGGESESDFMTVVYDTAGNLAWHTEYNGLGDLRDEAIALSVDNAGQVYVLGHSVTGTDHPYSWFGYGYDLTVIKYTDDVSTGIEQESGGTDALLPAQLAQNFPNPFNDRTVIPYRLLSGAEVRLEVFDLLGRRVASLVDGPQPAGHHTVSWNGRNSFGRSVASGMYFYRLIADELVSTKKMVLLK
jgi:hypothetical protein